MRRAYRAPVEPLDLQRVMKIYREGRRGGTFETGIEAALQRILAAPKFTFRVERDQPAYVVRQTREELVENLAKAVR